jgi:hypothetical protein
MDRRGPAQTGTVRRRPAQTGADRRRPAQTGADRRRPAQTGYFQYPGSKDQMKAAALYRYIYGDYFPNMEALENWLMCPHTGIDQVKLPKVQGWMRERQMGAAV